VEKNLNAIFVKKTENIVLLNAIKKVLQEESDQKTRELKSVNIAGKHLLDQRLISEQRHTIFVLILVLHFGGLIMDCMVKNTHTGWEVTAKKNIEMDGLG